MLRAGTKAGHSRAVPPKKYLFLIIKTYSINYELLCFCFKNKKYHYGIRDIYYLIIVYHCSLLFKILHYYNFVITMYSISQKWVHPSHFCKYLIISFHVTTVMGPTRREACGSMCKLLLLGMAKNTGKVNKWQTGILRARQMSAPVNGRGLRSANNIQRAWQEG